jgi:hypothetical protein
MTHERTVAEIDRAQVAAYRAAVQGLERRCAEPVDCAVLDIGALDRPPGRSGRYALYARSAPAPIGPAAVTVHSVRGELRIHRAADLALLIAATRGEDASALDEVAMAMREVVCDDTPRTKAELSGAVTPLVDPRLVLWCDECDANHVPDQLFRYATLHARLRVTTTPPRKKTPRFWYVPFDTDPGPLPDPAAARRELVRRFLRHQGPTTDDQLAAWLGVPPDTARGLLDANDPVPVEVAGRRALVHADDLDALRDAPPPQAVRLLAPGDPLTELTATTVGKLFRRGEAAGDFGLRLCKDDITVMLRPAGEVSTADRDAIEEEAAILAQHLGVPQARVRYDDGSAQPPTAPVRLPSLD